MSSSLQRLLVVCCVALALSGCAALRGKKDEGADAARPRYELVVQAPGALEALLAQNLDLARFRNAPRGEALTDDELQRLLDAAPAQAQALLATEGYFEPTVQARREAPAADGGLPRVVVQAEPGPRTVVGEVALAVEGDLQQRAAAGEPQAQGLVAKLREDWPLKSGEPFRQAEWTAAKSGALGLLHAGGYPTAAWASTDARVRRREQRADLAATARSGPLFHLGELRIEGLERYDEQAVRNVAPFHRGDPYSEQTLLDFQERLVRIGLFEGSVAEIDTDPARADDAPVTLRVKEQKLQQLTLGLGFSTDTGARLTAEHLHRQPFGLRWTAQDKFEIGAQRKAWEFDWRSYPKPGFRRNLVAGELERLSSPDQERSALRLRVGQAWEDPRLERQAYLELNDAHVRTPLASTTEQSLTANYDWTRRNVDSLLLPTRGYALLLQGAVGYARSNTADNGPLARAYGRLLYFRPFARDWHATLRLEAAQVFARQSVGVPDTLLFRAGGDESVRGYEYRSLGPVVNGVVTSGRSLLTMSAEVARPLTPRFPALWGAGFVDAGNAAARFSQIDPAVGVGVGLRYRSPVGPLKLDLAYGVRVRTVRVHLAAGVTF